MICAHIWGVILNILSKDSLAVIVCVLSNCSLEFILTWIVKNSMSGQKSRGHQKALTSVFWFFSGEFLSRGWKERGKNVRKVAYTVYSQEVTLEIEVQGQENIYFFSQMYSYNTWDSCNCPKGIYISNMSGGYCRRGPQIFTWSFKLIHSECLHIPYLLIHIHWQEN